MSYPNVPLGQSEWQRRVAQATNYLLNEITILHAKAAGMPDAAQELVDEEFAIPTTIIARECALRCDVAPTNNAVFTISIGGVSAGTGTILAGQTEGTYTFTESGIPAFDRLLIVAPSPQDPTLDTVRFFIALEN